MVGEFKPARGNMTHMLVMVDKFTKWIEVKPIRKVDGHSAVVFLKEIILRYGYPPIASSRITAQTSPLGSLPNFA